MPPRVRGDVLSSIGDHVQLGDQVQGSWLRQATNPSHDKSVMCRFTPAAFVQDGNSSTARKRRALVVSQQLACIAPGTRWKSQPIVTNLT